MARIYSRTWLALFPLVYLIHLVDERCYWIGTAEFATRYLGIYFTNAAWWAVNVPSFVLLAGAAWLTARGVWPQWVAVALAVHLALHGLGRVPTSLFALRVAPGLVTGLLLCTPLAAATLWRARTALSRRELCRREIARGLLAGAASFQPFWHYALLPLLPSAPG
jgi:hypothetical protein